MRRAVVGALALGVVVVVGAGAALGGVLPWWPRGGGPLSLPDPHGYALPVEVGDVVTDAFDMLVVEGPGAVVVTRITPQFSGQGVRTVGTLLSGVDREVAVEEQFYRTWPPQDAALGGVTEVSGTQVRAPDADTLPPQVLIGMEVSTPGHHLREGIWVEYRAGMVHYREFFDAQITFCTPEVMEGDVCPFLGDG
ncbi:hypothetical protein [Actinotalea sp. K2]|uniref:hypothetical protein n=1 Tax=Actinotalea sp. K2 TaxID=2939438 RepID=UPI0020181B36|nr:hypothetical protein [Actinotalea sp. K2]MCL3860998.1 hypothetical protein [Actinotalea sp. K2]